MTGRITGAYRAAALAVFCLLLIWPMAAKAADQAVVIMYHRFGEQDYPSTNIRVEQFEAHLAELTSGKFKVMDLPDIVKALKAGESLPDRTVGISIDDAYASTYTVAWPRLKKAGLPFTVFVSTGQVDRKLGGMMKSPMWLARFEHGHQRCCCWASQAGFHEPVVLWALRVGAGRAYFVTPCKPP